MCVCMNESVFTKTTTSLATTATVSAQDTIPGQAASNLALTLSIALNPLRLKFGMESLSAGFAAVPFNKTDPSQP